jgi:hypothetical protein
MFWELFGKTSILGNRLGAPGSPLGTVWEQILSTSDPLTDDSCFSATPDDGRCNSHHVRVLPMRKPSHMLAARAPSMDIPGY